MKAQRPSMFAFGLYLSAGAGVLQASSPDEHGLTLRAGPLTVRVDRNLTLKVYQNSDDPIWTTWDPVRPVAMVQPARAETARKPITVTLDDASDRTAEAFDDGIHKGHRVRLRSLPGTDAELEVILALSDAPELLVQIGQVGGKDTVQRIGNLYNFRIDPSPDAYMVVPHGSGYLIRSDSRKPVALNGFVGAAYSLPMFGFVRGNTSFCQIIETWWDAKVDVQHKPGEGITVSFDWEASLGKLSYARRTLIRFADGMDHVGMAKAYRRYLIDRKEFTTLQQRIEKTPGLKKYLAGVEYRWTGFRPDEYGQVLDNIRRFKEAGLPITFFFPKWPAQGYAPDRPASAAWQGFLHPSPVPGGWPVLTELADGTHKFGCAVKVMVNPNLYAQDGPAYDPAKLSGVGFPVMSDRHAEWVLNQVLDSLDDKGLRFEALYFDGYSAFSGHPEHRDAQGPVSRRQTYEAQTACFRETRRRGIIPGAELARFWSIADCDFFFFTDWSSDRLRDAEPIPLVPLVFHDCFAAHFSGGGYYDEGKYDWYADRHPRLYELMYAAMPSHNWLPGGSRPIRLEDWGTDGMNRRIRWLKRWHAYYQRVCCSEMVTHQFLNSSRTMQRVRFANDVEADFDLEKGLLRVKSVPGFTGDWETPEQVTR